MDGVGASRLLSGHAINYAIVKVKVSHYLIFL